MRTKVAAVAAEGFLSTPSLAGTWPGSHLSQPSQPPPASASSLDAWSSESGIPTKANDILDYDKARVNTLISTDLHQRRTEVLCQCKKNAHTGVQVLTGPHTSNMVMEASKHNYEDLVKKSQPFKDEERLLCIRDQLQSLFIQCQAMAQLHFALLKKDLVLNSDLGTTLHILQFNLLHAEKVEYGSSDIELLSFNPKNSPSAKVFCSLFFDEGRADLMECIYHVLRPQGQAIIMAPQRRGTLQKFVTLAQKKFERVAVSQKYNEDVWECFLKREKEIGKVWQLKSCPPFAWQVGSLSPFSLQPQMLLLGGGGAPDQEWVDCD
ncbi:unnamed protein product [Darwinula stevensoni]|uniref:Uncharacterized protein n=1 Tax=Darwinula stevensoni TaxID=69355 RepID=A0A7R8ZZX2_9CRUS|nr:unnamed protein product [Darwinula stevensoni]CAG0883430.1 unnamed protein product [Darwinula stevensoni]